MCNGMLDFLHRPICYGLCLPLSASGAIFCLLLKSSLSSVFRQDPESALCQPLSDPTMDLPSLLSLLAVSLPHSARERLYLLISHCTFPMVP